MLQSSVRLVVLRESEGVSGQKPGKGERTFGEEVVWGRKCGRRRLKLELGTSVAFPRPQENTLDHHV